LQEQSGQLGGDGSDEGGGQGSFWRSEDLGAASGLVVGEQDSHILPESTSSPSAPQQLTESSSALDKPSIVSASGTVVPSLNLSNVIASQISKSEKSKQEKGADNTDDDNTAGDNTFGFDDNTNELDQQPSFAFTDNEDFLFQKSMMDVTMATNTVMDDLTKQSTAAPPRKKSAKERRKQAQAREKRKKLLAPVSGAHGDIGTAVPGGQMSLEPARPKPARGYTQTCSFPTVEELEAAGRKPKGGTFPFAKRFPTISASAGMKSGGGDSGAAFCPALPTKKKPDKGAFSETKRFTESINDNPAPGDYNLRRMFEDVAVGKGKQLTAETSHALVLQIEEERTLRNQSCNFMSNQAVFGYGCSVEEHVKYGLCLDGQCGRRAKWEDVMLLKQDHGRLGHGGGIELSPKKSLSSVKSKSCTLTGPTPSINMNMSKKTFEVIDDLRESLQSDEKPDFSPLKTASLRGDFDTVVQLCLLGADINERDRLEQTIMHHAVLRNYLHIIVCLTEVAGYSECLDDKLKALCRDKSRGMFVGVVDLDVQDAKGNTPLHIAAMRGNGLMAEVLCDAGANPDGIRNNNGCTSSDIAKTQRLFQIIKMAQAKYEAETELNALLADRRSLKKQAVTPDGGSLGGEREEEEEEEEEFEVYEEDEDEDEDEEYEEEEDEKEEEVVEKEEEKEGVTLLPVSKHANKQHSYYVSYFGTPQEPKKKQSEREKFARFLKMRA